MNEDVIESIRKDCRWDDSYINPRHERASMFLAWYTDEPSISIEDHWHHLTPADRLIFREIITSMFNFMKSKEANDSLHW